VSEYDKLQKYLKTNQFTWLVTGVAGFIGSNLLEKLLILNQKVVGLDNLERGYKHNINEAIETAQKINNKNLFKNFKFIRGDIKNLGDCKKACIGIDYVLHQAALGSVPRSIKDPISTNKTNIEGFLNILLASKRAKVKNFVYASSSAVYGDHPKLPKEESLVGNPLSPYALTKSTNESYAKIFSKIYNFNTIGLRYFNIFGKRQDPNGSYAAVIPKWIIKIMKNENVFINGDGKTSRDFCYVENAIQSNLMSATIQNKKAINQVYNVAVGERTNLNKLYKMIKKKLIGKIPNLKNKSPIYVNFRSGDIKHSLANINKSKKLLKYKPEYNIINGIDKTIEWYISNSQ
jgi:UDP-N-acetylglucosamine 4-epimerase